MTHVVVLPCVLICSLQPAAAWLVPVILSFISCMDDSDSVYAVVYTYVPG